MCGIVGLVGEWKPGTSPAEALTAIGHRGPDGRGSEALSLFGRPVWLGHVRLAIVDLTEAGHQPMVSRDGRWWVIFNGEIYNHAELRAELEGPFRGHSDTETLVECIARYGLDETLVRLNGMFAFAALDRLDGQLYLARDPFGVKPLYYAGGPEAFAFSSEVRGLRATLGTGFGVDRHALDTFLTLRYVPSPRTMWQGVSTLAPGQLLTYRLESGQLESRFFAGPSSKRFEGSIEEATHAYKCVLRGAIERQMMSDVPVGVLLSGGIDSALVAAVAKESAGALKAFTVGFGAGHSECEIDHAAETARLLELEHHVVEIDPRQVLDMLPTIVGSVEVPLGTTSMLPMWFLAERASQQVSVVLTGQGSDEPWGGYRRYQMELLREQVALPHAVAFAAPLRKAWEGVMPEFIERGLRSLPVAREAARFVEASALFPAAERRKLTGRQGDGGSERDVAFWLAWTDFEGRSSAERMMWVDTRMNLADDLLIYGDKITMAHSIEARVPMLDKEVVRFVESLPLAYRAALFQTKIVHKRMAANYLPSQIVHRQKQGFQVPFGAWSRGIWREWIEDLLLDPGAPHFAELDRAGVSQLWREHQAGRVPQVQRVFSLLMLALWWRQQ